MALQDNAFHSAISIVWNFTILFIRLTIRDTSAEQNKAHQSLFHEGVKVYFRAFCVNRDVRRLSSLTTHTHTFRELLLTGIKGAFSFICTMCTALRTTINKFLLFIPPDNPTRHNKHLPPYVPYVVCA